MNKVLITGAQGQLGKMLSPLLPEALLTDVDTLDITDLSAVLKFVSDHKIGTIINCAAYTAVDQAEEEAELAEKINVLGPENLAKTGAKLIHISTDYVFDGKGCRPYTPLDETNPLSVYGKTKRLGEIKVWEQADTGVIIRTAWLYSPYGRNFVKTMRSLGAAKEEINVVADQVGTPTYAGDLAEAIVKMLPQIQQGQHGIYHFTNEGVCSWYDFAWAIMRASHLNCRVNPILSSAYPTRACRPFYSVLDKTQIKQDFGLRIPHWYEGLEKCLKTMEAEK